MFSIMLMSQAGNIPSTDAKADPLTTKTPCFLTIVNLMLGIFLLTSLSKSYKSTEWAASISIMVSLGHKSMRSTLNKCLGKIKMAKDFIATNKYSKDKLSSGTGLQATGQPKIVSGIQTLSILKSSKLYGKNLIIWPSFAIASKYLTTMSEL